MLAPLKGARWTPTLERSVELSGAGALAVALALMIDLVTYKPVGHDLGAYILAARRLLDGGGLYPQAPFTLGPFGHFLYPPPVALLFVPLAPLPFNAVRLIGLVALSLLAGVVIWHLVRALPRHTRYWAGAGMVLFFPLVWEVTLGNLTLVTLALCMAAWGVRGKRSSVAFAAALGLKLLAVPLLPFFWLMGRRAELLGALLVLGTVFVVTLPLLLSEWRAYADVLRAIGAAPPGTGTNLVPRAFAEGPLRLLLPAVGVSVIVLSALVGRSVPAARDHSFRVALAATPLCSTTLWYPYLVFTLPLLLTPGPDSGPASRAALVAARPVAWLLMQAQVMPDPGRDFLLPLVGAMSLLAVGVFELLIVVRTDRSPAPVPEPPRGVAVAC